MNKSKIISYDSRLHFFWVLVGVSMFSLALYVYAINGTTRNIAKRQALEHQIDLTAVKLETLEFAYIELRNAITMELAYQYGFREAKNPLYVSRSAAPALSYSATR
jgi:hypothetical protein